MANSEKVCFTMTVPKNLYGTNRPIPETGERNWGATVTQLLVDVCTALDGLTQLVASIPVLVLPSQADSLAASATLTPVKPVHVLSSTGGSVTLNATTAIANGSYVGQQLTLYGASDTDIVIVPDAANTKLNGDCYLANRCALSVRWDGSDWVEFSRTG